MSTITEISNDGAKGRSKCASRVKRMWLVLICATSTRTTTHVLKAPGVTPNSDDDKNQNEVLSSLYSNYQFNAPVYPPHPQPPIPLPIKEEISINTIADPVEDSDDAPSVCESLSAMTDVMKSRLVQLGVPTTELNYVKTELEPDHLNLPSVQSYSLQDNNNTTKQTPKTAQVEPDEQPKLLFSSISASKKLGEHETIHLMKLQELFTQTPLYDATFPSDQFTAFRNVVKDDRAIVEKASQAIMQLENRLFPLDFFGLKSNPLECICLEDIIAVMRAQGIAFENVRGNSLYRDEEYFLTRAVVTAQRLASNCLATLEEFTEMLETDVLTLESVVGQYSDLENEEEIMQLFGISSDYELKRCSNFEFNYTGTKLQAD